MELFCIDHLLMVEILSHQDMLTIDFAFPTTPGGATGEVTGLEAALQVPPPPSLDLFRVGRSLQKFRWCPQPNPEFQILVQPLSL